MNSYIVKAEYAASSKVDEIETTASNLSDAVSRLSESLERTNQEVCRYHQIQGETLELMAGEIYDSIEQTNANISETREIVEANSSSLNGMEYSIYIRNRRINKILIGMSIVSLLQTAAIIILAIWR